MVGEDNTVIKKDVRGNWLSGGHLKVCLLKLEPPTDDQWRDDLSRPNNVAMMNDLLTPPEGSEKSLLQGQFHKVPSFVLAPELSYGSSDFDALHNMVEHYPNDIILVCGFGFSAGSTISQIVSKDFVEGVWEDKVNNQRNYNGAWVWVKHGNETQCYIIIKNYFEQKAEIRVPNLLEGQSIFRLETDDLILFPLICADLICSENGKPSSRISTSLNNECSANKKVLVSASLLNLQSCSGHWKSSIGDLLENLKDKSPRLLLCNCVNPKEEIDENKDRWRCLSGGYQHREGSKPPSKPLPFLRYVDDTKFSGMVIRNTLIGCVFAKLKWTNNVSQGLHCLSEGIQYAYVDNSFEQCGGECDADELYRFVLRHKGKMLHNKVSSTEEARNLADEELDKLIEVIKPFSASKIRKLSGALFRKCLNGINASNDINPDLLFENKDSLDCALTTLKLIQFAIGANLIPDNSEQQPLQYGQLLAQNEEHEILVWDSSEYRAKQLYDMVKDKVANASGSARPLTVIGRGNGAGINPQDGKIVSGRLSDITDSAPRSAEEKDILEPRDRVVFWKNQGEIDEVLSNEKSKQEIIDGLKTQIPVQSEV